MGKKSKLELAAEEEAKEAREHAAQLMAARTFPYTYKLKHPFDHAGERVSEITFKRGKLGHLNGIELETPTVDELVLIASRMCGQTVAVLEQLEDEDGSEVIMVALGFFGRSLGAGGRKRSRT